MAYVRYKEVTKRFRFSEKIDFKDVPSYILQYVYDDEILLSGYKVGRDHVIITSKKIILFDNSLFCSWKKEIMIIPYTSVSLHSIIFGKTSAKIYLLLDSGHPLLLRFSNMDINDKSNLRFIYNAMSAAICGQKIPNEIIKKVSANGFNNKEKKEEK